MTTKQVNLRIPVGLLEAIDARRDADLDRTGVIIGLLTSALTGEYISPRENTATVINELIKTVNSLKRQVEKLTRVSSKKEPEIKPKLSPNRAANYYEDEESDDEFEDDSEISCLDDLDTSSLPELLTHQEMLDYFEFGEVRGYNAHFLNGEIRELHTLSLDVIKAIDLETGDAQIHFATDIDCYQKIKQA